MSISWRAVSAVFDSGTGVCAGFNSLYFALRLLVGSERPPSRVAAQAVLWLLSFGTFVEAAVLLAIAGADDTGPLATAPWAAVRGIQLVVAASLSALICRRLVSR